MAPEGSFPLLFISHNSQDRELAKRLVSVLKSALDLNEENQILFANSVADGFAGGGEFAQKLRECLDACRRVIVVITEKSFTSQWVMVEAGAAYVRRKLIPVVARLSYHSLVQDPLRQQHYLALDNAARIDKLIDQLRDILDRRPVKLSQYQEQIDELVNYAKERHRQRTTLTQVWVQLRGAPLRYRAPALAAAAFLLMAALRGLLAPVSFLGSVYEGNGAVVSSARVRLDTYPDVETDREGTWRFEMGWMPRNHIFSVRRPSTDTPLEGRWFGPNWHQWFGLEAPFCRFVCGTTASRSAPAIRPRHLESPWPPRHLPRSRSSPHRRISNSAFGSRS